MVSISYGYLSQLLFAYGFEEARERDQLTDWIWKEILDFHSRDEKEIDDDTFQRIHEVIARLEQGEPIQYIAGKAWFYGYPFIVTKDTLIPRPETEELVEWALSRIKEANKKVRVLDIGTGTGCIAITIKKKTGEQTDVLAVDKFQETLDIAKQNAQLHNSEVEFLKIDVLTESLDGLGKFDMIISNPPYVDPGLAGKEIMEALRYEPREAIYAEGEDPDIFYSRIEEMGRILLKTGGLVLLELNEMRWQEIEGIFNNDCWSFPEIRKDMQKNPRLLLTQKII